MYFMPPSIDFNCVVISAAIRYIFGVPITALIMVPSTAIPALILKRYAVIPFIAINCMIITFINTNNVHSVAAVNDMSVACSNFDGIFYRLFYLKLYYAGLFSARIIASLA